MTVWICGAHQSSEQTNCDGIDSFNLDQDYYWLFAQRVIGPSLDSD